MKSHVGPNGAGKCTATEGKCPFGGDEIHFNTIVEAREAFEKKAATEYGITATISKKKNTVPAILPPSPADQGVDLEMLKRFDGIDFKGVVVDSTFDEAEPLDEDLSEGDQDEDEDFGEEEDVVIPQIHALGEGVADIDTLRDIVIDKAYAQYDHNRSLADEICEQLEEAGTKNKIDELIEKYGLDED